MMGFATGRLRFCPLLLLSVSLLSCTSVNFIPTGQVHTPKHELCEIEIFSTQKPDRPYEEIGVLEGKGGFLSSSLEDILPEMKKEACRVGGDAIVLTSRERTVTVSGGGDSGDISSEEKLYITGTVIRWVEE